MAQIGCKISVPSRDEWWLTLEPEEMGRLGLGIWNNYNVSRKGRGTSNCLGYKGGDFDTSYEREG